MGWVLETRIKLLVCYVLCCTVKQQALHMTFLMGDGLSSIGEFGLAASDCTSIMIGGCRDSFLIKLCVRNKSYHHDCCRILTL